MMTLKFLSKILDAFTKVFVRLEEMGFLTGALGWAAYYVSKVPNQEAEGVAMSIYPRGNMQV